MCLVYLPVSTGRKSVFFRLLWLGYAPRLFVPVSTAYAYCVRLSTLYNSQPCMSSLRVRLESAADLCKSMCASYMCTVICHLVCLNVYFLSSKR